MLLNRFLAFAFLVCTFVCLPANASLLNNGSYTTDTESGLDWLDMSFTDGKSYNQALEMIGVGGSLEGWRFATSSEFDGLVNNAIGAPYTNYFAGGDQYTGLLDLIHMTGETYHRPGALFVVGFVDSSTLARADARQFGVRGSLGYVRPDYDNRYWDRRKNYANRFQGSFLVRSSMAVPEPTTLAIWAGFCGVGMLVKRRRTSA